MPAPGDSGDLNPRPKRSSSSPPWWLTIVLGSVVATSLAIGGWAAQAALAMRLAQADMAKDLERYRDETAELRGKVNVLPTPRDFDRLAQDMTSLRQELKDARADFNRRPR